MSNEATIQLIKQHSLLLDEVNGLILKGGIDAVLDYVLSNYINPDEAFIIGFMTAHHMNEIKETGRLNP